MAKKFLTLDIGAATVALAEYELGAKGALTLVNYGLAPLTAPVDGGNAATVLTPALTEIMREKGIRPGKVAVSVAGQMVFPRFAAIPSSGDDEKFDQLIRYEIEQNIPFPIDEMVCDQQVVGETEGGDKSVLIVAAKLDQIEALTAALVAAKFDPLLVDVAPIAVSNTLLATRPDEGCVVVLDIGSKTTSLVILEGERIYNRSIPVAGATITKEIATALGCSPEEAEEVKLERGYVATGGVTEDEDEVADRASKVCRAVLTRLNAEISRSINFYRSQQGGGVPTKLYLTGGTSLLPQADSFFAEHLGVEVEYLNPFEAIGVGARVDAEALESEAALLAPTAGLALHVAEATRYAIDLLPPSLVAERIERARIPFIAAAGVLLVAALALVMVSVNGQVSAIDDRKEEIEKQAQTLKRIDQDVQKGVAALAAEEAKAAAMSRLFLARQSALTRLGAVCKAVDGRSGMWIDRWDASGVTIRYWNDLVKGDAGKTVAESVMGAIGGYGETVIDRQSVKITSMSEIGKDSQVKQFTVEFKGK